MQDDHLVQRAVENFGYSHRLRNLSRAAWQRVVTTELRTTTRDMMPLDEVREPWTQWTK
jgi:hypothetical protein